MSNQNFANYGVILKKQMLNETHNARKAHTQWLRKVNHLVSNLPVDINTLPTDLTKTPFGQWLHSSGMKYKQIAQLEYYISLIDFLYSEIHTSYLKIHTIYSTDTKLSRLKKILIPAHKKVSGRKLEIAQFYMNDIKNLSEELLIFLNYFEKYLAIQDNEELTNLL